MLETAMTGTDAAVGVALLGDENGLEERVQAVHDHAATSGRSLTGLAMVAEQAVLRGERVLSGEHPGDRGGPGVPLHRQGRTLGSPAVARDVGQPPFDDLLWALWPRWCPRPGRLSPTCSSTRRPAGCR
jgi:hypothetical protein